MLRISDAQRRARLMARHALTPDHRVDTIEHAARAVVALHATDPSTIALSAWARTTDLHQDELHAALYERRSLVKHLAMRRTLFVFPRELLPAAQAAAADRVAKAERGRLIRQVEKDGLHADGAAWLEQAEAAVLEALAGGRLATAAELRAELPILAGATIMSPDKPWGGELPVGPRVLTILSVSGQIVRAANEGGWHVSRPRWGAMDAWLGAPIEAPTAPEGTEELVTAWLRAFGPGTTTDLKWWLGSTVSAVKAALAAIEAVPVELEGGLAGWVLPNDTDEVAAPAPSAALLPCLDPATMGWFDRDWYLGPHRPQLFDRNGNGGPTAWWDGRIVGGWRQTPDRAIELQLLEPVSRDAQRALKHEADRLADWLGDVKVMPRYPSPLSKS